MLVQELRNIGLTEKQAKVYLAVLELGEASIQDIAKKSGINRITCYQAVEKLARGGLVREVVKSKKTKIVAEMPKKLLENLFDKKMKTERNITALQKLLPELDSLYNYSEVKPKIRFYEGREGLKKIYQDTLDVGQEILAFTAYHKTDKKLADWLDKYYIPQRVKKEIFAKVIAPAFDYAQRYQERDKEQMRETLLISATKFPLSIEINVYGNKVAIISFAKKEMMGVIIESKEVASTFCLIFQLAWQGAVKYKENEIL